MHIVRDYFKSSLGEFKKISWPSKADTIKYTYAVIGLSLALAAFFGVLDYFLNMGFEKLLHIS